MTIVTELLAFRVQRISCSSLTSSVSLKGLDGLQFAFRVLISNSCGKAGRGGLCRRNKIKAEAGGHPQVSGVERHRSAYAWSLLLALRANERAPALGSREYGISPARREPRRRSRKRARAGRPVGRRQAFRRF